ncbi:MAG: four helix bundle protein [Salinibacter sp.]
MRIDRFEDIQAWRAARELTRAIYDVTSRSPFSRDFGLRDQIQRASVSIMANIAEGFDSASDQGFIQFLGYALRSATEVQSHLYVALD